MGNGFKSMQERERRSLSREWHEMETCNGFLFFVSLGDDHPWFFKLPHTWWHSKSIALSPRHQYSLASVIQFDGSHFKGIRLDAKNSHGNHLIYDGMNGLAKRIQIIKIDDPISKYAFGYKILELWYVKVDSSSAEKGSASPSTALKPFGIPNLGHTCYLTTLAQIILWVIPLRKRWTIRDSKKYNQSFQVHWRPTVIVWMFLGISRNYSWIYKHQWLKNG